MSKKLSIKKISAAVASYLVVTSSFTVQASGITTPHIFASGDTVSAASMNQNFSVIKSSVDDNNVRITNNTSAITVNKNNISSNTAAISANASSISNKSTEITANTASITTNKNNISNNTTAISANAKNFNSLKSQVQTIENTTTGFMGYAKSFSVLGAAKNVNILYSKNSLNSGGNVEHYRLVISYENNSEQVSVNGILTTPKYIWKLVDVNISAGAIQSINSWTGSMANPNFSKYNVETASYNIASPSIPSRTILSDNQEVTEYCSDTNMVHSCFKVTNSIRTGQIISTVSKTTLRSHLSTITIKGMTFNDIELRRNLNSSSSKLRISAKGVGRIFEESTQAANTSTNIGLQIIYYRENGNSNGSLSGTPFAAGGALSGVFF